MAKKITWEDKEHILPYGTRENQVWDLDMNEIKTVVNANADSLAGLEGGYQGVLLIADTPTNDGYYLAGESGTYTNAGSLVVDLTDTITFINKVGVVYTKTEIPLTVPTLNAGTLDPASTITAPSEKTVADYTATLRGGTVASGETKDVSGGTVFTHVRTKNLGEYAGILGLNQIDIYNDFSTDTIGFQNFNGGVISLETGRLKVVASGGAKGCGINPTFMTNGAKYTIIFDIDLNGLASVKFYQKWATVLQTITTSGTYTIIFTADNSGAFPYPIFAPDVAGTFYLDNVKLIKENATPLYASKTELQLVKDFSPTIISQTEFLTIPSYVSAFNGGVISIDTEKLKVVSTGQQGFQIKNLTSGEKYSLQFYIDIGTTTGVKILSANPTLITTITKTGYYDITIPSVSFGVVEFLTIAAGTIYVDFLNIYQNVKWATENQVRVAGELSDLTGGNFDTRLKIGKDAVSSDNESVAVGGNSQATQDKSTALGVGSQATFNNIYDATANNGGENLAVGNQSKALSWRATANGAKSIAGATSSTAIGFGAVANKVHGTVVGRGCYLPNNAPTEAGAALYGADGCNDLYLNNGWGHQFDTPPSGISIQNYTPNLVTKRLHGQDAYDSKAVPTSFNIEGGNVALSAGRGTGTGKGGKVLLETAPSSGTKGSNEKNDLVAGAAVTSETTTDTRFQLLDNATGTLKDVKYYVDGSSRKILYID